MGKMEPLKKRLCVTISGLHGTGKSTYAKSISSKFDLRHISAGHLFRQIARERGVSITELSHHAAERFDIDRIVDVRTKMEAEKGNVVIDGLLAGWVASEFTDIKVYLTASEDERFSRIAKRDNISICKAQKLTILREEVERKRFKKYYAIDLDDLGIYDLVINTGCLPIESNLKVISKFIHEYISFHGGV